MAADIQDSNSSGLLAFLSGDPGVRARLVAGESLSIETPFRYPGRRGPVIVHLVPGPMMGQAEANVAGPGPVARSAARHVRINDGGDIIKSLEEQGMDLASDMIISKTVFHLVKQVDGAAIAAGRVYLDSNSDDMAADIWRFLQMVAEIVGLRHSKYKDALVQLSRRQDAPDLIGWEER